MFQMQDDVVLGVTSVPKSLLIALWVSLDMFEHWITLTAVHTGPTIVCLFM